MVEVEDEVLPPLLPVQSSAGPGVLQQPVQPSLAVLVAVGDRVQRHRDKSATSASWGTIGTTGRVRWRRRRRSERGLGGVVGPGGGDVDDRGGVGGLLSSVAGAPRSLVETTRSSLCLRGVRAAVVVAVTAAGLPAVAGLVVLHQVHHQAVVLAPPELPVVHLQPDHVARGEAHQAGGGTTAAWPSRAPS